MKTMVAKIEISRIEKRTIEAMAVAPLIQAVSRKIGLSEARSMLMDVNQREAFERGRDVSAACQRNGIEELVREVAGWGADGDWEMEVLEQTPVTYFFNVLRCPYYERYRALGIEDLGVALSYCRDEPFARGFNPKLRLKRTQTIMEGAAHCDFRYYLDH